MAGKRCWAGRRWCGGGVLEEGFGGMASLVGTGSRLALQAHKDEKNLLSEVYTTTPKETRHLSSNASKGGDTRDPLLLKKAHRKAKYTIQNFHIEQKPHSYSFG